MVFALVDVKCWFCFLRSHARGVEQNKRLRPRARWAAELFFIPLLRGNAICALKKHSAANMLEQNVP